jgi:hypothetical protein
VLGRNVEYGYRIYDKDTVGDGGREEAADVSSASN